MERSSAGCLIDHCIAWPSPCYVHCHHASMQKAKQDDALSDLSDMLTELKGMAVDKGSEIERQTKAMGDAEKDYDELNFRQTLELTFSTSHPYMPHPDADPVPSPPLHLRRSSLPNLSAVAAACALGCGQVTRDVRHQWRGREAACVGTAHAAYLEVQSMWMQLEFVNIAENLFASLPHSVLKLTARVRSICSIIICACDMHIKEGGIMR
ncbi:unnamed protein product [Urochloa humidicola]